MTCKLHVLGRIGISDYNLPYKDLVLDEMVALFVLTNPRHLRIRCGEDLFTPSAVYTKAIRIRVKPSKNWNEYIVYSIPIRCKGIGSIDPKLTRNKHVSTDAIGTTKLIDNFQAYMMKHISR